MKQLSIISLLLFASCGTTKQLNAIIGELHEVKAEVSKLQAEKVSVVYGQPTGSYSYYYVGLKVDTLYYNGLVKLK